MVIVTALESDARYQQLVAAVQQQLELVNKEAAAAGAGQQLLPLAEVEVSLAHTLYCTVLYCIVLYCTVLYSR